jgi:transcriptional regulator with XRE-family HTH domain
MSRLKRQRRMVGLTQHELARLAGIGVSRIAFAETGRTKLTDEELERVFDVIARRAAATAGLANSLKLPIAGTRRRTAAHGANLPDAA